MLYSLVFLICNQYNHTMKKIFIILGGLIIVYSCSREIKKENLNSNEQKKLAEVSDTVRDGIFIHITESYNDPHRVLMPLKMANMMAQDKDVIVYLDIHAVELVTKTSKDMQFADFEPLKKLLQGLIDKKVGIYACPTCMKIANIKPEDLIDGVQVAQKDKFFNFTKGRIITLDY
jgi:predicted peroxiredoxin